MIFIERTNAQNNNFIALVKQLDVYLAEVDGKDHSFYDQFNQLDKIKHAVVAFENGRPVGCGAIKAIDQHTTEVKRMYTSPESRGKGIAASILRELELWALELSFHRCVLETGKRQTAAIGLYNNSGYHIIPNYGQYADVEYSVCFEKLLNKT